jgi:drug/metabolite transporter (DMT)-like permease
MPTPVKAANIVTSPPMTSSFKAGRMAGSSRGSTDGNVVILTQICVFVKTITEKPTASCRHGAGTAKWDLMPAERERFLALGAALVTVALWASAFVGIRAGSQELTPGALALGRLTIAGLALGLVVLVRREPLPSRRDLPAIAFVGITWFGLYNIALMEAERRVDAGTAAMLVNIGPILIAVLAGVVLREGFPRRLLAGCAIAFLGAVLIGSATSKHGLVPSVGLWLCLAAALFYAVGVVAQKPLLARVSALQITWLACIFGALICLPFAGVLAGQLPHVHASTIGWMLYLALGPMALGFLTWGYALARTTAGRMGSTTYLVPPIAILLGWLLLGETPPLLAIVGGAFCLAGVAIARRRSGREASPAPSSEPETAVAT